MSELGDKRKKFTRLIIKVLGRMIEDGYEPMIGKDGLKHMSNSLHYDGLAMDIDLTKDGVYLPNTEDHRVFGTYWESLDPDCFWGGPGDKRDGLSKDGNHYAITMSGRK
jgi:hypothetical protein